VTPTGVRIRDWRGVGRRVRSCESLRRCSPTPGRPSSVLIVRRLRIAPGSEARKRQEGADHEDGKGDGTASVRRSLQISPQDDPIYEILQLPLPAVLVERLQAELAVQSVLELRDPNDDPNAATDAEFKGTSIRSAGPQPENQGNRNRSQERRRRLRALRGAHPQILGISSREASQSAAGIDEEGDKKKTP